MPDSRSHGGRSQRDAQVFPPVRAETSLCQRREGRWQGTGDCTWPQKQVEWLLNQGQGWERTEREDGGRQSLGDKRREKRWPGIEKGLRRKPGPTVAPSHGRPEEGPKT